MFGLLPCRFVSSIDVFNAVVTLTTTTLRCVIELYENIMGALAQQSLKTRVLYGTIHCWRQKHLHTREHATSHGHKKDAASKDTRHTPWRRRRVDPADGQGQQQHRHINAAFLQNKRCSGCNRRHSHSRRTLLQTCQCQSPRRTASRSGCPHPSARPSQLAPLSCTVGPPALRTAIIRIQSPMMHNTCWEHLVSARLGNEKIRNTASSNGQATHLSAVL